MHDRGISLVYLSSKQYGLGTQKNFVREGRVVCGSFLKKAALAALHIVAMVMVMNI